MSQGLKYSVDIVMCIDVTGSMSPIIGTVKDAALRFHEDLSREMESKGKYINALRVKVISFRDYWADGADAISSSDFFELPANKDQFSRFVSSFGADGGGDEPENGLEALTFAIRSDWTALGDRRRHLIIVWTDASAHPLEKLPKPSGYPSGLPSSFNDLTDEWEGQSSKLSRSSKRVIVFGPEVEPWKSIASHWENSLHLPSQGGQGLAEVTYKEILNAVVNSV